MAGERREYKGFEGGAVFTAEEAGKFLVIIDVGTLLDLLDEEDREGLEPVTTVEFETEAERSAHLLARYGPPRPRR